MRLFFLLLLILTALRAPAQCSENYTSPCVADSSCIQLDAIPDLPLAAVRVQVYFEQRKEGGNFHCDPAGDPELYAPTVAEKLLAKGNQFLAAPDKNANSDAPQVPDTRFRYVLTGNPDSVCSAAGVYLIPPDQSFKANAQNEVLEIVVDFKVLPGQDSCNVSGTAHGSFVKINNLYTVLKTNCMGDWDFAGLSEFSRNLNHELGHIFKLPHAHSRCNTCPDMSPAAECGGRGCPDNPKCRDDEGQGHPSWGGNNQFCCYCTWGTGNNMMGYNGSQSGLTPCQWETMFNYVLDVKPLYLDLCAEEQPEMVIPARTTVVWDTRRVYNGDIRLERKAKLILRAELQLGAGKKIIRGKKAELLLEGGSLSNACATPWGGVVDQD